MTVVVNCSPLRKYRCQNVYLYFPAARLWWRGRLARVQGFLRIGGWLPAQTRGKVRHRHAPGCSLGDLLTIDIPVKPKPKPKPKSMSHVTIDVVFRPAGSSELLGPRYRTVADPHRQ